MAAGRRGCNRRASWPPSLSLSLYAAAHMKRSALIFLAVAVALGSGCARDAKPDESMDDALKRIGRISYYDRNGDGKVDEEMHRYVGVQDADWALRDDDYNGRFEKKIRWGIGVFESAVDLPVPTGVHIDTKP